MLHDSKCPAAIATVLASALIGVSALAHGESGVGEVLAAPQPLFKVAPTGNVPEIVKVADVPAIRPRQAQSLLDGHLGPNLKMRLAQSTKDGSFRLGRDGQSLSFVQRAAQAPSLMLTNRTTMSSQALQEVAKAFVAEKLLNDKVFQSMFRLRPEETLTLSASFSRVASVSDARTSTTQLLSRAFVFSRKYNGVPILGPGNRVVVTLASTGEPIGLTVMLPRLAPSGRSLDIVPSRQLSAGLMALGAAVPGSPEGRNIRRIRCGYFDPYDPTSLTSPSAVGGGGVIDAVCDVDIQSRGAPAGSHFDRIVISIRA